MTPQRISIFRDIWDFARQEKKMWMAPLFAVLLLLGMFLVFAQTSALAPFIYTLF